MLIVAALAAFSQPAAQCRLDTPRNNTTYEIQDKPSYLDKLDDPITILTFALVVSTVFLWRSTDRLARLGEDQSRITNDLFVKDQRPWLNVFLKPQSDKRPIFADDGSVKIFFSITAKNIGKAPAFDAADGIDVHIGYQEAEDRFEGMRRFAVAQSNTRGKTIFPGDEDCWSTSWTLTKEQVEQTLSDPDGMQFITIGYAYASSLIILKLETVRTYKFGIGDIHRPLPTASSEAGDGCLYLRLWRESVT